MRQSRLSVVPVSAEQWKLIEKMASKQQHSHDRQYPRHRGDAGVGRRLHLQRCADQARRRDGAIGPGRSACAASSPRCGAGWRCWRPGPGARSPIRSIRKVMLRSGLEAAAAIIYLIALFQIPFAIATAVNLSMPLILTVLAVIVLKEDVRWRRWTAVGVGFVGVLLVIQPRPGDINGWTWVALTGDLPRRLPRRHRPPSSARRADARRLLLDGDHGRDRRLRLGPGGGLAADRCAGLGLPRLVLAAARDGIPVPRDRAALGRRDLGDGAVPLFLDPVGARHRLRGVGRGPQHPGARRHRRRRGAQASTSCIASGCAVSGA